MRIVYDPHRQCTIHYDDNDLIHREDGPALIFDSGTKKWSIHGKLHRLDGPACEWSDGSESWYANDYSISQIIKSWAEEMGIDLKNLTEDDKIVIAMIWHDYGSEHILYQKYYQR